MVFWTIVDWDGTVWTSSAWPFLTTQAGISLRTVAEPMSEESLTEMTGFWTVVTFSWTILGWVVVTVVLVTVAG